MPTIHQLIRKKRKKIKRLKKSPALSFGFNVLKNRPVFILRPSKEEFVLKFSPPLLKNQTQD
jgi:ribosomal protein S12